MCTYLALWIVLHSLDPRERRIPREHANLEDWPARQASASNIYICLRCYCMYVLLFAPCDLAQKMRTCAYPPRLLLVECTLAGSRDMHTCRVLIIMFAFKPSFRQ